MHILDSDYRGVVGIFKPQGPTSHDMIDKLRRHTGERKIGHAGTLDPLAEGVLLVAIGRTFTKQLGQLVKQEKEYLTKIKLGVTSTTDDQEGKIIFNQIKKNDRPDRSTLTKTLFAFTGNIWQVPPQYSAIKINGIPAYKLARQGQKFDLKPRQRQVKNIDLLEYNWPFLKLRIVTGSGVYIRSLARDIGAALGVGGYMASLIRTRVGECRLDQCFKMPLTST